MGPVAKPWVDLDRYREVRIEEAIMEAGLAEKFLEIGLVHNAAGKAFQAWKALLGALAVDARDELAKLFNRDVEVEGSIIKEVDYVIALVPTTRMRDIARALETRHPGTYVNTLLALELHKYQYNGADPEGVLSVYRSDEDASIDVRRLIEVVKAMVSELRRHDV